MAVVVAVALSMLFTVYSFLQPSALICGVLRVFPPLSSSSKDTLKTYPVVYLTIICTLESNQLTSELASTPGTKVNVDCNCRNVQPG